MLVDQLDLHAVRIFDERVTNRSDRARLDAYLDAPPLEDDHGLVPVRYQPRDVVDRTVETGRRCLRAAACRERPDGAVAQPLDPSFQLGPLAAERFLIPGGSEIRFDDGVSTLSLVTCSPCWRFPTTPARTAAAGAEQVNAGHNVSVLIVGLWKSST
jgi:hypothetical protein